MGFKLNQFYINKIFEYKIKKISSTIKIISIQFKKFKYNSNKYTFSNIINILTILSFSCQCFKLFLSTKFLKVIK